jgi:hypothetical protein
MTGYIHPIKDLQGAVKRAHQAVLLLGVLLGISIVGVPWALRQAPVVVLDQDGFSRITQGKPWQLTTSRVEGFTKLYLANRFEWTQDDFDKKRGSLQGILTSTVFDKLHDSLAAFSSISKTQSAKCFYVLEGWGFSNADKKIEAHIDRVIRIRNAVVATPLTIHLTFQESQLSDTNPYGLKIDGIEELEPQEGGGS